MKEVLSPEVQLQQPNFKKYNPSTPPALQMSHKSFTQWATENRSFIEARLIDAGIAFLNDQAEDVSIPLNSLITDNRWHYLHKSSKKQSYRAALDYNSDGIPYLALTYYTFRHGGHSERFDSKAVLKALWQETSGAFLK